MDTNSQYQYVQLDDRDGFVVELRASRINYQSMPDTPGTITYVDKSSRVLYAQNWNEVLSIISDYGYVVQAGDLIVIPADDGRFKMYVATSDNGDWKEMQLGTPVEPSNKQLEMIVGNDADRLLNTPPDGTLFFAQDTQKIYLYNEGNCIAFSSNNVSSGDIINSLDEIQETISLPAGETLITLTEGAYVPGGDNITVSIDGMVQPTEAYVELNDHQLQFKQPIDEDVIITVEYFAKK